jgi:tRNA A-37 threonylcarbamoyl transferase component Bud32
MILVTQFIEGNLISDILKQSLEKNNNASYVFGWINVAGQHFAKIHAYKCTLGKIKPSNLIVYKNRLYFTGLDEFGFNSGDPLHDIIYFISYTLEKTLPSTAVTKQIIQEFFEGYSKEAPGSIKKVVRAGHYPGRLYTEFDSSIIETIKEQIFRFVN